MPDEYQYDVFLSHNSVDKPEVEIAYRFLVEAIVFERGSEFLDRQN